jgi:peptide/nickel transport system permease protein
VARYFIRTTIGVVPTLLVLVFAISLLVRLLPGNAVDLMLTGSSAKAADRLELERELGLDRSIAQQYVAYLGDVVSGTLGRSLYSKQSVIDVIRGRLAPTLELTVLALSVSSVLGVAIGVTSAARRNSKLDYLLRSLVNLFLGIPNFVVATLVVLLPAYYFGWTPPLSYVRIGDDLPRNLVFFIAPATALGVHLAATMARVTRTQTLEVLHQDYVRTAQAKGLAQLTVLGRHALRNALLPVVTLFGIQLAAVLSGIVIIEQIFSIPGMGTLLLQKIQERDYPVVQGITLLSGVAIIVMNLILDFCYTLLDPRVRIR